VLLDLGRRALFLAFAIMATALSDRTVLVVEPLAHGDVPCDGAITLRRICDDCTETTAPQPFGRAVFQVAGDAKWRVVLTSSRCWAPAPIVDGAISHVDLPVWPAAPLRGRVAPPPGIDVPKQLRLLVRADGVPPTAVDCPVVDRQWHCTLPKVALEVRLAADGFIPLYLFGVAVPHDLGTIALKQGGSVSGWVQLQDRTLKAEAIHVELVPHGFPSGARTPEPVARTSVNARGFFQFRDVPPSLYDVVVRAPHRSAARAERIHVTEAREYLVEGALILRPPAQLEVVMQPAFGADGKPWTIALARAEARTNVLRSMGSVSTTADGRHLFEDLDAGYYSISVHDSRGATLQTIPRIDVAPGMAPVIVQLTQIPVRGRVRSGGAPMRAKLLFRGSGAQTELDSDDDGNFAGMLAREGKWSVHITPSGGTAYVIRSTQVRRSESEDVARVELDVSGGEALGTVVDEKDHPLLADVFVLRPPGLEAIAAAPTQAADGAFRLFGLDDGPVVLEARTNRDELAQVAYEVRSKDPQPAKIVIRPQKTMRLWLTTPSSDAVPGALVRYCTSPSSELKSATSDPAGEVSIVLPSDTTIFTSVILGPGLPAKMAAIAFQPDGDVHRVVIEPEPALLRVQLGPGIHPMLSVPGGVPLPLFRLATPTYGAGRPPEMRDDGWLLPLDAGGYTLCAETIGCRVLRLIAGQEVAVDVRGEPAR
jgi:hypothetical protein